jgi:hypothetical protein
VIGHGPADALEQAIAVPEPASGSRCTVEHLADLDTAPDQLVVRGLDVGDGQQQGLGGARFGRGEVRAELDRAPGARRGELDQAEVITDGAVGVEPHPSLP